MICECINGRDEGVLIMFALGRKGLGKHARDLPSRLFGRRS